MTASEKKWLAKTSDIVVDQFEGHNGDDLSAALAALASGSSIIEKTIPRQVIVVNPDIAITDEIEGKLYRTYSNAYAYTHNNLDTLFTVELPSGVVSGIINLDNNVIIDGHNTTIDSVASHCVYPEWPHLSVDGGIIRHCMLSGGSGGGDNTIDVDDGDIHAYLIFEDCCIQETTFKVNGDVSWPAAHLIFSNCTLDWSDNNWLVDSEYDDNAALVNLYHCIIQGSTVSGYALSLPVFGQDTVRFVDCVFRTPTALRWYGAVQEASITVENSSFEDTLFIDFNTNPSDYNLDARVKFSHCLLGSTTVYTASPSNVTRTQAVLFNDCCWRKQDGSTSQFEPITLNTNSVVWLIGSNASLGATGGTSETFQGYVAVRGGSGLTMASSGTGNCYARVHVDTSSCFDPSQVGTGPVFGGAVTRTVLPVRYATDASGTGMSSTDTGQAYVGLMLVDGRDQNTAASYTWINRPSGGSSATATTVTLPITESSSTWHYVDSELVCTVTVSPSGTVAASNTVFVTPAPASLPEYLACGIYCKEQAADALTFRCTGRLPDNQLTVNVVAMD